ncbi:MAG: hypothetical protein KY433_11990, partial [Actinobacteria bacterium]|nr:hypothetical protein [Actinomycetota bacterium]
MSRRPHLRPAEGQASVELVAMLPLLVAVALAEGVPLLTNDGNLDHVAQLQGVPVLNINRLADAV